MKQGYFILCASIATALAGATSLVQPAAAASVGATASNGEAPRITQTINNNVVATVQKTHLKFVEKKAPVAQLPDSFQMNHLQLILKSSDARRAALASLIAEQHDPKSPRFHQWLTPEVFGQRYGASDADIATLTAWLKSQGFTVNFVYPNKTQIDFSGTAGQIKAAFHAQEAVYSVGTNKENHIANTGDIRIPSAIGSVVAGVMGLNDFHPKALNMGPRSAHWSASKKSLVLNQSSTNGHKTGGKSQAINVGFGGYNPQQAIRGLVPNDMATMYGISAIRANGITGAGVTIAVVEDSDMVASDWTNFESVFNLQKYGGTFSAVNPQPDAADTANNVNNCQDPHAADQAAQSGAPPEDDGETLLDAEWSAAIAPGANIVVASCADYTNDDQSTPATSNFFGGVYIAATNLINAPTGRPDVISASYGYGEFFTDAASKTGIDNMWEQADAEGISVFVSTGDSGSNPSFNGGFINGYYGNTAVDANAFATSPNVTGVGGTDLADIIDGTTSQYFAPNPSVVGGSALSYVPEIPWNQSCGNGVAAKSLGYANAIGFCNDSLRSATRTGAPGNPNVAVFYSTVWETSEAGSGGPSAIDAKPTWQSQIYGAAADQSRDLPDVSLFAGSFGDNTFVAVCSQYYVCSPDFTAPVAGGSLSQINPANVGLSGGTSLASPMFAGIQALMDQGLAARGVMLDQGNAAPTLYALASNEYGTAGAPNSADLTTCNADNGANGTANCVFHNVTRGSISSGCYQTLDNGSPEFTTPNCYFYNTAPEGYDKNGNPILAQVGLTITQASSTSYSPSVKAYSAQPGWSFASGLGSVNARNLLIAWRAFAGAASSAATSTVTK
jgi:subtilase family serine protease